MNRLAFQVEAGVLAAPAIAFTLWALPNVFLWSIFGFLAFINGNSSLIEFLSVPVAFSVGMFGLSSLAKLVIATSKGQKYRFGISFWLGLLCGLMLGEYLHLISSLGVAAVIICPLLLLAAHAAYIQLSKSQQGIQLDGPASGGPAS